MHPLSNAGKISHGKHLFTRALSAAVDCAFVHMYAEGCCGLCISKTSECESVCALRHFSYLLHGNFIS